MKLISSIEKALDSNVTPSINVEKEASIVPREKVPDSRLSDNREELMNKIK